MCLALGRGSVCLWVEWGRVERWWEWKGEGTLNRTLRRQKTHFQVCIPTQAVSPGVQFCHWAQSRNYKLRYICLVPEMRGLLLYSFMKGMDVKNKVFNFYIPNRWGKCAGLHPLRKWPEIKTRIHSLMMLSEAAVHYPLSPCPA